MHGPFPEQLSFLKGLVKLLYPSLVCRNIISVLPTTCNLLQVPKGSSLNRATTQQPRRSNTSRRRTEDSLAVVFMAIILTFLVCHTPRILLDIHEVATIANTNTCRQLGRDYFSLWSLLLLSASHFLLVVNSSVNMVVYCLFGSKFRAEFKHIASKMIATLRHNKSSLINHFQRPKT
jgi:hypothetical protein